jgi:MscS family membrane protein
MMESIKDFFSQDFLSDFSSTIHSILHGKFGHYLWIFILLPIGLAISFYIAKWIFANLNMLIIKRFKFLEVYVGPAAKPITLLITSILFETFQGFFTFGAEMQHIISYFNILLTTISIVWLSVSLSKNFFEITKQKLIKQSKIATAAIFPIISKLVTIAIVIIGVLFALKNIGFDIGAIIAALGIGGIGVALASQKNIENLFGGIILSVDQPIRVGDVGKFNGIIGTVIDVGLRSTKVQTPDRTIMAIPNATLSSEIIETYAYRDKILLNHNIVVKYGASSLELQNAIKKIKEFIVKDKRIDEKEAKVNITKFNERGMEIDIFAYALTTDLNEYLKIQEDLILKINDIILKETQGFGTISN